MRSELSAGDESTRCGSVAVQISEPSAVERAYSLPSHPGKYTTPSPIAGVLLVEGPVKRQTSSSEPTVSREIASSSRLARVFARSRPNIGQPPETMPGSAELAASPGVTLASPLERAGAAVFTGQPFATECAPPLIQLRRARTSGLASGAAGAGGIGRDVLVTRSSTIAPTLRPPIERAKSAGLTSEIGAPRRRLAPWHARQFCSSTAATLHGKSSALALWASRERVFELPHALSAQHANALSRPRFAARLLPGTQGCYRNGMQPSSPKPSGAIVLGVLSGGRARRMGGLDKALLPAPDTGEALAARLLRLGRELGLECVIVGGTLELGAPRLSDEPASVGPIGGVCALCAHAGARTAIALACDLPYLSRELLEKLVRARSAAPVLCPRDPVSGKWQPLFARYDAPRVLPALRAAIAGGERSFQGFLRTQAVEELELSRAEHALLRDWDEPADLEGA